MKIWIIQTVDSKDIISTQPSYADAVDYITRHETVSMWEVVITEHEVDMKAIAYLVEGRVVCLSHPYVSDTPTIPMTIEHFGKYSQNCSLCHKEIVKGKWKTELFPTERDPAEFRWVDMQQLLAKFDLAITDKDWEVVKGVRQTMYERILRAIMVDKFHDRKLVFDALDRVMQVETKW